ncbi:MAG: hypothetical protein VKJ85_03875 [Prochlorothrix sp.]|nr:hypothetical protein [Prochlorothrix sp.]
MTPETAHYQAVGLVRGIYSDKALHIRQGSYPAVGIRKAKWHLDNIENQPFRFLIYPRFDLKAEVLKFQILAWSEFQDEEDEWKLAGLWQFIPQLRRPVLAVHRNEKHWEGDRLKSCYLPFVWKGDDTPRPWRFNPRATKEEQGQPMFVACTATLDKRFPRFFMKDLVLALDAAPQRIRAPKANKPPAKKPTKPKRNAEGSETPKPIRPGASPETAADGAAMAGDIIDASAIDRSAIDRSTIDGGTMPETAPVPPTANPAPTATNVGTPSASPDTQTTPTAEPQDNADSGTLSPEEA